MALRAHYAKKCPPTAIANQKNTLAGPQLEKCIFKPLRATSASSPLVSKFHVSQPSTNEKNPFARNTSQSRFMIKNTLARPLEIKKCFVSETA